MNKKSKYVYKIFLKEHMYMHKYLGFFRFPLKREEITHFVQTVAYRVVSSALDKF